jgi:hypothetical protein
VADVIPERMREAIRITLERYHETFRALAQGPLDCCHPRDYLTTKAVYHEPWCRYRGGR